MNPSPLGRALVAIALLGLPLGCRTVGTAVGTAGRAAGATAEAAGQAAGTAATGAGQIVEDTAKEADREVRGK
jgi:hypothetical protein